MKDTPERIFISYAHDNDAHKQNVLDYSNWLNDPGGFDCWIDRYIEDSVLPEGWQNWMRKQIASSKYVIVVCSEKYLARYDNNEEEEGKGLGVKFESTLIENDFYQKGSLNHKFIPVIFKPDDKKHILDILQNQTYYDLSTNEGRNGLYRKISNQPQNRKPAPSSSKIIFDAAVKGTKSDSRTEPIKSSIPEIEEYKIMKPGSKILQAFFQLSFYKRMQIAKELKVMTESDVPNGSNLDRLSTLFLKRIHEQNLLSELWTKLFDESIDPNPFKNK